MKKVNAIFVSDLHLSHHPPSVRDTSKVSWYKVMIHYFEKLSALRIKYDCPIIIAGDLFNHWNQPPELINFVLEYLPSRVYAIPGQHDLPNHRYDLIKRSAYWTLVEAGKITTLISEFDHPFVLLDDCLAIYGFPWKAKMKYIKHPDPKYTHIAVIHKYIWMGKHKYPTAKDKDCVKRIANKLKGYDVVVAGDNHKGFLFTDQQYPLILNCGAFIRRTVSEIKYTPTIGLLHTDKTVTRIKLNTEIDHFVKKEAQKKLKEIEGLQDFLDELQIEDNDDALDFAYALRQYVNSGSVNNAVRKRVIEALEASSVTD